MPAAAPPPQPPKVVRAAVGPRLLYAGGRRLRMRLGTRGGPGTLRIEIQRRSGRVLRAFEVRARPPHTVRLTWNGLTRRGRVPADAHYRVIAGPRRGRLRRVGGFVLHGHAYPVAGPHRFRGAIGTFGAPRNGGRTHEGFDIVAACGTPVVAARGGLVRHRAYDPVLYGNNVIVHGFRERRDYRYAHLAHPARVRRGQHVRTGQRIGRVGATGNARTVGCHLHFELHGPGGPFDPLPRLRAWDSWS